MSYTNTASAQYSAIVKEERVTMTVGDISSQQVWASFGRLNREEDTFQPQIFADAAPMPVPGGGAVSHTTLFTALPDTAHQVGLPLNVFHTTTTSLTTR
jgi:hypothetical protein